MVRKPRTGIDVGLDDSDAQSALKDLRDTFERRGSEIDQVFGTKVSGSLDGIIGKVGGIKELGGAFGPVGIAATATAGAVAAAAAATVELTRAAFELTDATAAQVREQRQFAENLGVSIESFSAFTRIAADFGATGEDINDVIKDLTVRAVESEKEFTEFGISVRDANGRLLTGEALFLQVADAISDVTDKTRQLAIADALASDAGERAIGVLRQNREALEGQRDALIESGRVISRQTALLEQEYTLALNESSANIDEFRRLLATELLPVFIEVIKAFNQFVELNRDDLRDAFGVAADGLRTLTDFTITAAGAANALAEAWVDVGQTVTIPGWLGFFDSAEAALQSSGETIARYRMELESVREELERLTVPFPNSPFTGERGFRFDQNLGPARSGGARGGRSGGPRRGAGAPSEGALDAAVSGLFEDQAGVSTFNDADLDAAIGRLEGLEKAEKASFDARRREAERFAEERRRLEALTQDTLISTVFSGAQSIVQIGENLAGESAAQSEGLFYVQQGINAAQAGVYTFLAANRAIAELGPIAGPVAAGLITVAGLANVAAILSASPGSPPQSTGGGFSGVGAAAEQAAQAAAQGIAAPTAFSAGDGLANAANATFVQNVTFNGPVGDPRRLGRELRRIQELN